jgi:phage N-6-adenine-methyltransferase
MRNRALFTSQTAEWETPLDFYNELDKEFGFSLDPCCAHDNAKCEKHYTIEDNGLVKSWSGETVFCNPPYGREMPKWIEKCYAESQNGATVVMLIPARTDTIAFHKFIYGHAEIRFVKGRLKFGNAKNSAPFPSMVVVFRGTEKSAQR